MRHVLILAATILLGGCTASQLASTDRALGGTPATIPSTQPGVVTIDPSSITQLGGVLTDAAKNPVVQVAASATPPYGSWVLAALGIAGTAIGAYKTAGLSKTIANAAPGVAALVNQATDGKVTPADITTIEQVSQGVLSLINHPAAATAVASAVPPVVSPVAAKV